MTASKFPRLLICCSFFLTMCMVEAKGHGADHIRLTHILKAQLIDMANSLEEGGVPPFKNSQISDKDILFFSFTYAMMHSRQKANGHQHLSAKQLQMISYQFFERHFSSATVTNYSYNGTLKIHNGFYDGDSIDPPSSPGGYEVTNLVQLGPNLYKVYLNSYGVQDEPPSPAPYCRVNIVLKDVVTAGKHHFIVAGYSGEENQPTIRPRS